MLQFDIINVQLLCNVIIMYCAILTKVSGRGFYRSIGNRKKYNYYEIFIYVVVVSKAVIIQYLITKVICKKIITILIQC